MNTKSINARGPVRWCCIATAVLCAGPMSCGCSWMSHKERSQQAEQHWDSVRSDMKVQLAAQQFEGGHLDAAVTALRQALALNPDNAAAHLMLARCYLEQGKVGPAERAAQSAARLNPNNASLANLLGLIAERSGQHEQALGFYHRARQLDDAVLDYLIAEAECLAVLGRADESLALLEEALVRYDNDPSIHALMGEIALCRGEKSKAFGHFQSALAGGTANPIIVEQYAMLAADMGRFSDAVNALDRLSPKRKAELSPSARRTLARCYLQLAKTEQANALLNELIRTDPNDLAAWRLLAESALARTDVGAMRWTSTQIHRIAPYDSQALLIQAYLGLHEHNLPAAARALEMLLDRSTDDLLAHCLMGEVALRSLDTKTAIRHFSRALEIDPHCELARSAMSRLEPRTAADATLDTTRGG